MRFPLNQDPNDDWSRFVAGFMTKNAVRRLGCIGNENQIRSHAFFKDLDWEALEQRRVKPPFRPRVVTIKISNNFSPHSYITVHCLIQSNVSFIFPSSTGNCAEESKGRNQFRYRIHERRARINTRTK